MSRARRRPIVAWVLVALVAFVLGGLFTWILTSSNTLRLSGSGGGESDDSTASFAIRGDLSEPVSPGVQVPLDLSIANSHDEPMLVSDLTVTVESVDAPHASSTLPCGVEDFVVEQLDTSFALLLDPGETMTLTQLEVPRDDLPTVGMVDSDENQDGCKAATVELSYAAVGRLDP